LHFSLHPGASLAYGGILQMVALAHYIFLFSLSENKIVVKILTELGVVFANLQGWIQYPLTGRKIK